MWVIKATRFKWRGKYIQNVDLNRYWVYWTNDPSLALKFESDEDARLFIKKNMLDQADLKIVLLFGESHKQQRHVEAYERAMRGV